MDRARTRRSASRESSEAKAAALRSEPRPITTHSTLPGQSSGRTWIRDVPSELRTLEVKVEAYTEQVDGVQAFLLERLPLPAEKGEVLETWQANQDRIQAAIIPGRAIKQERPSTRRLRRRWLEKVGWNDVPEQRWAEAADSLGYEPAGARAGFDPKVRNPKEGRVYECDIDHIIELQFLGDNTAENLQCLDSERNQESGRKLNEFLQRNARALQRVTGARVVLMQFASITQPDGKICEPGCEIDRIARTNALMVDNGTPLEELGLQTYDIVGSRRTTLLVPPLKSAKGDSVSISGSKLLRNRAASTLIPGFILNTLKRMPNAETDEITLSLDSDFEWPFKLRGNRSLKGDARILKVDRETRQLRFKAARPELRIFYPFLSEGTITDFAYDPETGLSGSGMLKPSIPILNALDLGFSFTPDSFEFTSGLDQESLKRISGPFRGVEITEARLAFLLWPDFIPSGRIAFAYGPEDDRLVTGLVTASADEKGFRLDGMLMANIPRVDSAAGTVSYSARKWSGQIDIASSQIKIPGYRSGSFQARLVDDRLRFGGQILLGVPLAGRDQTIRLGLTQRDNGSFLYTGEGTLDLPRVKDARVSVSYDGETFRGRGQGSIDFRGFEGTLRSLDFSLAPNGTTTVSGMGTVRLPGNQRTQGSIDVNLSPQGRFSGSGMVRYKVSESLTAEARVVLGEDETLRVEGALRLRRIELFPEATGMRQLLRLPRVRIPVPQASIAGYGVVFTLDGGVDASYSFGPGALEDVSLTAAASPLERNADFSARIMGNLVVPARAGLTASVRGGLGLDVGIASATGGLTLYGMAGLTSAASVAFSGSYERGRYQVQAAPAVMGNVSLAFGVNGDAQVEIAGREVYERTWNLASYQYPSLLQLGAAAMVGYDSANGFRPPAITNLQLTPPPFMLGGLLDRLV